MTQAPWAPLNDRPVAVASSVTDLDSSAWSISRNAVEFASDSSPLRWGVRILMVAVGLRCFNGGVGSTAWSGGVAQSVIDLGHLAVGGAALVFAGVLVKAGRSPNAELGGVFVGLGFLLAVAALAFTYTAVLLLRGGQGGAGSLSLVLSIVELVGGVVMAVAVLIAVQGYGAFEPWRSPLLLPSAALIVLGLAGVWLEIVNRRG